jgi:hypothetical protein
MVTVSFIDDKLWESRYTINHVFLPQEHRADSVLGFSVVVKRRSRISMCWASISRRGMADGDRR